jgi:hypothetical protein
MLPDTESCQEFASALAKSNNEVRAMNFGAEQLLAQQRGLWQIVAARHAELEELN